jgi:hypothetical protein
LIEIVCPFLIPKHDLEDRQIEYLSSCVTDTSSGIIPGRIDVRTQFYSFSFFLVWLVAAMNADKFLAVCLPLRVSDLLSRKKAYAVVIAVIFCSMLVASVPASRTVLKNNAYCWLKDPEDEKLVFILDAFFCCFVPFIVISILNAAIFLALLRARREASQLHESTAMVSTSTNQLRSSVHNRARAQSQNIQITIMLITISISFFVLTLPNAIYYLFIFLRVFIESWKAVKCDANVYRNLDKYVRTSVVMFLISNITSDLMHVVNFFLYFISGARFRNEFRRLIFHQLCRWCSKQGTKISGKNLKPNQRSFIRANGVATVRALASLPGGNKQQSTSNDNNITSKKDQQTGICRSSTKNNMSSGSALTSVGSKSRRNQYVTSPTDADDKKETDDLLRH